MTAEALAADIRAGRLRARDAVEAALHRARDAAPLGALVHLDPDGARAAADALDARRAAGAPLGPLAGVPVVVKDNLARAGDPLRCATRALDGYTAPYTATAVARLEAAGAIVIGRGNMDELAMGSSTETSAYFPAKNPWNPRRVPGGSSGGCAAAVAAGVVPLALGSDTGGSARQPAALCGVVGLKPTWGRVSRWGLMALASSMDQVAPMAGTTRDAAICLSVISGPDDRDSAAALGAWTAAARPAAGMRVGVLPAAGVEPGVAAACAAALDRLRARGVAVVEIDVPGLDAAVAIYQALVAVEASSNLARLDGLRYGGRVRADSLDGQLTATRTALFGPEVRRRVLLGTALATGDRGLLARATAGRARLAAALDEALRGVDALASPTSATIAFPLGARASDPAAMAASDRFTAPASLAGLPAISVPAGWSEGLPVGLHLTARAGDEGALLALAGAVEER